MFDTVKKTNSGFRRACGRCAGTGFLAHYANVWNGTCFKCDGVGALGKSFATAEECQAHLVKLELAREKREAKREAERIAHEAELAQWKHLSAELGESVTVTGVVSVAVTIDTQWGSSRLIVIESAQREAIKLFTTAEWAWDVQSDEALTVTGVVKSFDNYDGKPQTVLNRPKRIGG